MSTSPRQTAQLLSKLLNTTTTSISHFSTPHMRLARMSSTFALPREILGEVARALPGRERQIGALGALVAPRCVSPRNIVVYGLAATGKSEVVRGVLDALSETKDGGADLNGDGGGVSTPRLRYAIVKSAECVTGRHLLERTVAAVADAVELGGPLGRCENLAQLAVLLGKMLDRAGSEEGVKFVLVFDGVDAQRDAPPTLLPALARMGEVIQNLTTIFIVTSPRPHFLHNPGAPHIHFPSYTKQEAIAIVSRSVPVIYTPSLQPIPTPDGGDIALDSGEDKTHLQPSAKETTDLYVRFLSAIWDTFAKQSGRDILSFRRLALTIWPRFTAPIREGIYGPKEFQKLLVSQRPLFRDESLLIPSIVSTPLHVPPSTISTSAQSKQLTTTVSKSTPKPTTAKPTLPTPSLPYTSRILLIAAYLASYTPARLDPVLFSKSSSLSKKRRRKNLGGSAAKPRPGTAASRRRLNRKLLGPQAFVMERCLAIFRALLEEANGGKVESGGADVLAAVATLGSLRLLGKTSRVADPLEGGCKWKVNIGWEAVRGVGRSVGIEVEEWIVE